MLLILAIPAALTSVYGRMVGNRRQGWAIFSAMLAAVRHRRGRRRDRREQPDARHARRRHRRLQHGGQGAALRHRARPRCWTVVTTVASCGAVNGAMEALTGIGGARPDGQHADRRGDLRRRRLGPLRDADVRDPRRLPVRPDGRPHAGVPRQEDRGPRGQADRDRHDRRADARALHEHGRDRQQVREGVDLQLRAAGLVRDALRVHVAGQQQRLGVRRLHRLPAAGRRRAVRHHVRERARRRRDAVRPLPAAAGRARDRRLARRTSA